MLARPASLIWLALFSVVCGAERTYQSRWDIFRVQFAGGDFPPLWFTRPTLCWIIFILLWSVHQRLYRRVSVSAPWTALCARIQTGTGKPLRCVAVGVSVPAECNRCETTRKLFISLINNNFIEAGALSLLLLYVSLPKRSLSLK